LTPKFRNTAKKAQNDYKLPHFVPVSSEANPETPDLSATTCTANFTIKPTFQESPDFSCFPYIVVIQEYA
jgi:hypothetical protein